MGRIHLTLLLAALSLGASACRDTVDDPTALRDDAFCAGTVWYPDADGDGYGDPELGIEGCDQPTPDHTRYAGDCDDGDEAVHEDGVEVADARDNDCDGEIDEGTPLGDADKDGFCADAVGPCADPQALPGDCDDADAFTFPGAFERCDGVDNDCNGALPADELDGDADGFSACQDCDDGDATRFPGAVEACDGLDRDCDGAVDDLDLDGDGWVGCPQGGGLLDVVLMVDGRPEAAVARERLAAAVPDLLTSLHETGRDGRILLLSTDDPTVWLEAPGYGPNTATDLAGLIPDVTGSAVTPMTTLAAWRVGADGPRPGAAIAAFIVSPKDDGTAGDPEALLDLLATDRGRDLVRVSTIGGEWTGCGQDGVRADPSPRIGTLVARTEGLSYPLCDTSSWFVRTPRRWVPPAARDCDDTEPEAHAGRIETCDGVDNDCDGLTDGDADQDGVTVCEGDCDDRRADVYPGAVERCDGLDSDCDGGVSASERDADGDGWRTCDGDCNDSRSDMFPGAAEVCGDGLDANCDGEDGSDDDHADLDGDGWSSCAGDCDDGDPWAFPHAPEHKFDGRDDDCDGLVDGEDDDVVIPWTDPGSLAVWEVSGPTDWYTFCGQSERRIAVSTEGYLLPGGGVIMDSAPSSQKMRDYAPFVAAGWANLNPSNWTGGTLFPDYEVSAPIYVVKRANGLSVVYDHVPYQTGGGHLSSITTLGHNLLSLHVLEGEHDPMTLLGWACDDGPAVGLNLVSAPTCVPTSVDSAAGIVPAAASLPVLVTSTCAP